jgi:hypothetical protein
LISIRDRVRIRRRDVVARRPDLASRLGRIVAVPPREYVRASGSRLGCA